MDAQSIEQQIPLIGTGQRDEIVYACTSRKDTDTPEDLAEAIADAQRSADAKWLIDNGYIKLPSIEELTKFFKPLEHRGCDAGDVAQGLIDWMRG